MADPKTVYSTHVSGFLNTRHEWTGEEGRVGEMIISRNALGLVNEGEWRPAKGEVLRFQRDPGMLRAQFTLWSDGREWIGSSLRDNYFRRLVNIHTGGKPFQLVPASGFSKGWSLIAPKSGEVARMETGLFGRDSELKVYRRLDFPLLLFAYFLGFPIYAESVWPAAAGTH